MEHGEQGTSFPKQPNYWSGTNQRTYLTSQNLWNQQALFLEKKSKQSKELRIKQILLQQKKSFTPKKVNDFPLQNGISHFHNTAPVVLMSIEIPPRRPRALHCWSPNLALFWGGYGFGGRLTHRSTSFRVKKTHGERSRESTCKQAKVENTCSGVVWCGSCTNILYRLDLQGCYFWLINHGSQNSEPLIFFRNPLKTVQIIKWDV